MFTGRIGIKQYWLGVLLLLGLALLSTLVIVGLYYFVLFPMLVSSGNMGMGGGLLLMFGGMFLAYIPFLVTLPFSIGLQVRRFHDMGITGWMVLVLFVVSFIISMFAPATMSPSGQSLAPIGMGISLLTLIAYIVIFSWPGTKGPNTYGDVTYYPSIMAAIRGKNGAPASALASAASVPPAVPPAAAPTPPAAPSDPTAASGQS